MAESAPKLFPKHTLTSDGTIYSVDSLILASENAEVTEIPIQEIEHCLDYPCWSGTPGEKIKPSEVLRIIQDKLSGRELTEETIEELKSKHPHLSSHFERIFKAQTQYPILTMSYQGETIVVDGMHRLSKQVLDGETTIKTRNFDTFPDEAKVRLQKLHRVLDKLRDVTGGIRGKIRSARKRLLN